jgi:hypothetical protein
MDERVPAGPRAKGDRAGYRMLCLVVGLGLVAGFGGCTRAFFRKSADKEVADVLAEKDKFPAWKIEQYHVYPDPRARFADPTNPDRPPMPPDDPAAYDLSPHPQHPGHAGVASVAGTGYLEMIKTWDSQNRAERIGGEDKDKQTPDQPDKGDAAAATRKSLQAYFDEPLSAKQRGFLLTLEQAVELGLVNSQTYQSVREDLYLAALPVTQQRFSFAYQWAVIENAVRQWAGPLAAGGQQNNWSLGTTASFSKLFSTGALLTFAFANQTVFNFNSNSPFGFTSASTINLDLVQPFLRGGGKAVTLEPLTQAERNLVYVVRSFARFRRQFFVAVAIGSTVPGSLVAVTGASSPISALAALNIASTDVSGGFVGYLSTLFRELDLAADRKYVQELETALKLFEGLQEGGQVAPIQVAQVNSTLLGGRNTVLSDIQFATNALDQFKLVLGLPANLPLILDDTLGRPITRQLDRYYEILAHADAAAKLVEQQEQLAPEKVRAFLLELFTTDPLVRGTKFQKELPPVWESWAKMKDADLKTRLQKLVESRRKLLDTKTDLEMKGQTLSANEAASLRQAEFESDVGQLEQVLRRYEARPREKQAKEEFRRLEQTKLFRLLAYSAELVGVWARNERFTEVYQHWPVLPGAPLEQIDLLTADVDEAQEKAVQYALTNRVDLMNARGQVVDAWRQLAVTANALLGVFNASYQLTSQTPPTGTNPLAFATSRTGQQLILNGQLPLTRLVERNTYRTSLITYQRARRSLMILEDSIASQVRFDVRQLHLFGENYKIQKKIIESLYSQVENALEVIAAPVDPDQLKATGTSGQANAAALTSQYLTALGQLNGSQTKMYDIWLSFLATRMQLYLDLERLPLDSRGVWIDESGNPADLSRSPAPGASLGEPLPVYDQRGAAAAEPLPRPRLLAPAAGAAVE